MKTTKKQWTRPQIEEVTLEAEEDVLATCFTASQTSKSNGQTCRLGQCATYP